MSYPRDLDEYSDREIEKEYNRRRALRLERRCTYCRRREDECASQPCKIGKLRRSDHDE